MKAVSHSACLPISPMARTSSLATNASTPLPDMEYLGLGGTYLEGYKLFPYLAEQSAEAVFILNTRDREAWIRSRFAWRGDYADRHRSHYNVKSDEQLANLWRAEWDRHHRRVIDYFACRSSYRFFVCRIETDLPNSSSMRSFPSIGWTAISMSFTKSEAHGRVLALYGRLRSGQGRFRDPDAAISMLQDNVPPWKGPFV